MRTAVVGTQQEQDVSSLLAGVAGVVGVFVTTLSGARAAPGQEGVDIPEAPPAAHRLTIIEKNCISHRFRSSQLQFSEVVLFYKKKTPFLSSTRTSMAANLQIGPPRRARATTHAADTF